jgi:protease YdgD
MTPGRRLGSGILALAITLAGAALGQDNSGLDALSRRDEIFGWEAVGRIDIENGGFCTGALIATDLVLTAGHCVYSPDGASIDAGRMTFRAGLSGDRAIAEVRVARTVTHPDFRPTDPIDIDFVRHDVALLQLETPILAATAAPFTVESPGDDADVSVVSYAEGREDILSWQRVCKVLGKAQGLIAVDCDVTFGASGAPVLDRSFGRARIVSVISGGYRDDKDATVAYGMDLPKIVAELKAMLRKGDVLSQSSMVPARPAIRRIGAGDASRDIGARFVKP